jgi:vacuolar-type H+-ATPase subunit H
VALSTDYTETLKKIKETEEASSREILERRKALEEQLRALEAESAASIAEAKAQAEEHVADEVEKARKSAQKGADALLAKTGKEASAIASKRLDKKDLKKIIDNTLFSEFK